MTTIVASNAFDMAELLANGSLAEFFEFGTVQTGTSNSFVVTYSDETISERLTLTGTFSNYVDGYPTLGTINAVTYWLDGADLFTISDLSISVEDFTNYVMSDNLQGLFEDILSGNDSLTGSDGNDVLLGFDGDDSLRGGLGSDELRGGNGNDLLSESSGYSGPFNDIYDGGAGVDRVSYFTETGAGITIDLRVSGPQSTGSFGIDTLIGIEHVTSNYGDDTLIGNDADNWFWTFSGFDQLTGNGGNDYFTVGLGTKILDGGAGSDTVEILDLAWEPLYTAEGIVVSLLLQGASQATGVGNWTLTGIENLVGSFGSDEFTGDSNANYLGGAEGDDRLIGGHGDDTLAGDGTIGIDSADGTSGPIEFIENPGWVDWVGGNDYLDGGAGNDGLIGGSGDDFLIGGAGLDTMDGGEDSDVYAIAASSDHPLSEVTDTGASGTDEIRFSATGSAQTLVLRSGDTGIERVTIGTGTAASAVTTGTLAHNVDARALINAVNITGNNGANILQATALNDTLSGLYGIDRLYGFGGNDLLDGGRDADVMFGGSGDDTYIIDNAGDLVYELLGEGTDTVQSSITHYLRANVENLVLTGSYSVNGRGNDLANMLTGSEGGNRLAGLAGDDIINGNGGRDILDGGTGNDVLVGGADNDIYVIDSSADVIVEEAGEGIDFVQTSASFTLSANVDRMYQLGSDHIDGVGNDLANLLVGNSGYNILSGMGGNDRIFGGAGNDALVGGDGNDYLEGGTGQDNYNGGSGSDYFVFRDGDLSGTTSATADHIYDFAAGDRISLSPVDANTNLAGNQAFNFIGNGAFTGTAGELRYEWDGNDTILLADTNGDGLADFAIGVTGMVNFIGGDFIL